MKQRLDYLDLVKALAIILVVIGHVIYFCIYNENSELSRQLFLTNFLSFVEMPLFVFCSGLVAKCRIDEGYSLKRDLYKKVRTLIIPFFIFGCSFALFSELPLSHFANNTMKLGYWYLLTLFELHLLNYLFIWISSKYDKCKFRWAIDCIFGIAVYFGLILIYRGTDPEAESWKNVLSLLKLRQYYLMFFAMVLAKKYNLVDRVLFNPYVSAIYITTSFAILLCNSIGVHILGRSFILPWTLSFSILSVFRYVSNNQPLSGGGTMLHSKLDSIRWKYTLYTSFS